MKYRVERATETDRDFAAILDYLVASHLAFGEEPGHAWALAAKKLRQIERGMLAIGRAPHQGTLRPDLMPGLRFVTRQRATYYFLADDDAQCVRVLAIFFGGQDHARKMLLRLLTRG